MSTFPIPPLPGETLHSVITVAERAGISRQSIYKAIRAGRISAVIASGYLLIAESEAARFVRERGGAA